MSLDSKNPCMGEADAFSDSSSKEESRRLMQHIPPNSRPRGNKESSGSDDMDETRNPMYLSLESDFDSLLFDVNWMDGQSANNNGLQGGNGGGFSADIGDVVKVEARQSLLTAGPHDQHGAAAAAYQATSTGTAAGVGLNSLTPFPNASFVAHELGNGGTNNHASSYAHTMQSAPGATFTVNASDNTTYNNPALQTLAFNAMAASASLAANSGAGPMSNAFFMSGDVQQQQPAMMLPPGLQQQQLSNAASSATATPNLPPFLLFDAPIELRANFIASQRAHGLPPLADNNMLHYQQQQQLSSKTAASTNGSSGPRLIDGRHGDVANNRVKNEREQKRTQKIADLIDQLREKMEHGGWKVGGAKSKYATLSTCAEYVKHLVQVNKEKELEVEKTKSDLEAKRRKVEDEANARIDPSDPESTTSSLTISLDPKNVATSGDAQNACAKRKSDIGGSASFKQRDASSEAAADGRSHSSESQSDDDDDQSFNGESLNVRKRKASSPKSTETTSMDNAFELDYEEVFLKSNIPQLLATTSGRIISWNDFFLKATGLLATDVERLTIFSLVRQSELSRLFEIVAAALRSGNMNNEDQDDEDAENKPEQSQSTDDEEKSRVSDITTTGKWNYTAITLPCATFRPRTTTEGKKVLDKPLYITVTLMTDDDPRKRCFHCVFTDCPGTNGALGSVTAELLSLLFTQQPNTGSVASASPSLDLSASDTLGEMVDGN